MEVFNQTENIDIVNPFRVIYLLKVFYQIDRKILELTAANRRLSEIHNKSSIF